MNRKYKYLFTIKNYTCESMVAMLNQKKIYNASTKELIHFMSDGEQIDQEDFWELECELKDGSTCTLEDCFDNCCNPFNSNVFPSYIECFVRNR